MIPRPASFCCGCNYWSGVCKFPGNRYQCNKKIDQIVRNAKGHILELRIGTKWYYSDFVENRHRKAPSGKTRIGFGECGVVYRDGNEAVKAIYAKGRRTIEGEVYAAMSCVVGIATGRQDGNEIRTPFFANVVSKYTIIEPQRLLFGPFIAINWQLIGSALRALSEAGYSYGDALQFGVDDSQRMLLLDFSAAKQTTIAEAADQNAGRLRELAEDFQVKT